MTAPEPPLYLSGAALEAQGLSTRDVIASIERALRAQLGGELWAAPKSVILPPDGRYVMSTLALADDPPYMVSKSLIVNPANAAAGEPGINACVTLSDSASGRVLAVLDGNWVTAIRTAGLSAVAARRLARADARVLALIGCGVQARSHLRAFAEMFPLRQVRAFGRGAANRDALCAEAEAAGLEAVRAAGAADALAGADIVVSSVTLAPDVVPFVDARVLERGAFAAITDQARPWLPDGMAVFDRIVIDDLAQERLSATPMVAMERVAGDLGGLVEGRVPPRGDAQERTAFLFRGLAVGDFAVAALAYDRVRSGAFARTGRGSNEYG